MALLPLFREHAHSASMIRHAMEIIYKNTNYLNPGQTRVITMDQPLYAIAKKVQWQFGGIYSERRFVCMLGPLHVEMAALRMLDEWLSKSGWTTLLVDSKVTTSGRAESIIGASHIGRSRYSHQVTIAALYVLQHQTYDAYIATVPAEQRLLFDEWVEGQCEKEPMFMYLNTACAAVHSLNEDG